MSSSNEQTQYNYIGTGGCLFPFDGREKANFDLTARLKSDQVVRGPDNIRYDHRTEFEVYSNPGDSENVYGMAFIRRL